jgi:hypothetical protein
MGSTKRLRDDRDNAAWRAAYAACPAEQGLALVTEPGYADSIPVLRLRKAWSVVRTHQVAAQLLGTVMEPT